MQTADQLKEEFALEDVLRFDEPHPGMPRVQVRTPACSAELYLQGAHLTGWQPAGEQPVLFLSERSAFAPGKAIRGGVPVIFPWFGAPQNSPVPTPRGAGSHGFARISPWTLRFAALAGDDVHLSLTLDATPLQQEAGFVGLQLGIDFVLGQTLTVRLTAVNASEQAQDVLFEEALHAYFRIGDVHQASIRGLAGTEYLDKTENFQRKTQTETDLRFSGETDRPYLNTKNPVTLQDPVLGRRIVLSKTNSDTTVIWNPAAELNAKLPDLAPEDWLHFACMETANAAENALTLTRGQAHTMTMHVAVEAL